MFGLATNSRACAFTKNYAQAKLPTNDLHKSCIFAYLFLIYLYTTAIGFFLLLLMKVFKFGGASLKSAASVENILPILEPYRQKKQLLIVVSAMGKTTNALEELLDKAWKLQDYTENLVNLITYHQSIAENLLNKTNPEVQSLVQEFEHSLQNVLYAITKQNANSNKKRIISFDQFYDKLISLGEWVSSKIVYLFLQSKGFEIEWADARQLITTDSTWREGKVNFKTTNKQISNTLLPILTEKLVITQGFIASNAKKQPTTLGREGSDYSAAIFAAALNAENLTIWKDVAGVLNADPKKFPQAQLFAQLSYHEAAEMSYYGASVIHPKTIAPLAQKNIPLLVKSFLQPLQAGTCIDKTEVIKMIPAIMIKEKQAFVTFTLKKLLYIQPIHINNLLTSLDKLNCKIYALHQTAFQISFCIDDNNDKIKNLQKEWAKEFRIQVKQNLQLITVKNADNSVLKELTSQATIILQLQKEKFVQYVIQPNKQ